MTDPATELNEAKLMLNAALQEERDAFDALIALADEGGDAAQIDIATAILEQANGSVTTLQTRITALEAAIK